VSDQLTSRDLQSLRNIGNESERAADIIESQAAEIAALNAERDTLRADAERYRWLRGGSDIPPESNRWARWEVRNWDGRWWNTMFSEQLDAALDAARTQAPSIAFVADPSVPQGVMVLKQDGKEVGYVVTADTGTKGVIVNKPPPADLSNTDAWREWVGPNPMFSFNTFIHADGTKTHPSPESPANLTALVYKLLAEIDRLRARAHKDAEQPDRSQP
jgi:hypothetical protein